MAAQIPGESSSGSGTSAGLSASRCPGTNGTRMSAPTRGSRRRNLAVEVRGLASRH